MHRVFPVGIVAVGMMIALAGCERDAPSRQDTGARIEIVEGAADHLPTPGPRSSPKAVEPQDSAAARVADREDRAVPAPPPDQPIVTPPPTDEDLYRAIHGDEPSPVGPALSLPVQPDATIQ